MEVIFHLIKISLIVLSSNEVYLQLLGNKFCSFPAVSLLFRPGGWADGRAAGEINTKANSAQLSWDWG
jgi:hypothetical protein